MQNVRVNLKTDLIRAFFDASADAIVIVDEATHTVVDANAQALIDTEYRTAGLNGVTLDQLFLAPRRVIPSPPGRIAAAAADACDEAPRLLTRNGHTIAVDARVTPVRFDDRSYLVIVARKSTATHLCWRPAS